MINITKSVVRTSKTDIKNYQKRINRKIGTFLSNTLHLAFWHEVRTTLVKIFKQDAWTLKCRYPTSLLKILFTNIISQFKGESCI